MIVFPAGFVPLFSGIPVPLHEIGGPRVQPEIFKLAALTSFGICPARNAACTSAMASIALFAQSPPARPVKAQSDPLAGAGNPTVAGVPSWPMFPTV